METILRVTEAGCSTTGEGSEEFRASAARNPVPLGQLVNAKAFEKLQLCKSPPTDFILSGGS